MGPAPSLTRVGVWWRVPDAQAESANKGWKWFLFLNFLTGAVVFLVLFEWWELTA